MSERAAARDVAVIEQRVRGVVASIIGDRPIGPASTWRELGMDSLDLLSLVTSIEEEFDLQIPDQAAMRLRGIADVVALVSSPL